MCGKKQRMLAVAGVILAVACSLAQAQGARDAKIAVKSQDLRVDVNIPTPAINANSSLDLSPRGGKLRYWIRLSVDFDTLPEWIDEVKASGYIVMQDQKDKKVWALLRGNHSMVNVAKGQRHHCVFYLHPQVAARFNAEWLYAAIVLKAGDTERVVTMTKPGAPKLADPTMRWWEKTESLKVLDRDRLLARWETPFACLNYDDYEQPLIPVP